MSEPQKCACKGCKNFGETQEGFDFFVCASCFDKFEAALNREWDKKHGYPKEARDG